MPQPATPAGYKRHHLVRLGLLALGWLLLAITPLVGPIPGPGGVITFAAGASLLLKNSAWAKGRYVRLERRWPRFARWSNMALRRRSPRHRAESDSLKRDLKEHRWAKRQWARLRGRPVDG